MQSSKSVMVALGLILCATALWLGLRHRSVPVPDQARPAETAAAPTESTPPPPNVSEEEQRKELLGTTDPTQVATLAGSDPRPEARAAALKTLADHPFAGSREAILRGAGDADATVRMAALQSLEVIDAKEAVRLAGKILAADSDSKVKLAAVDLLGASEDDGAVALLAVALQDKDPEVRVAAVDALSDPDHPQAAAPLLEALRREKDDDVRDDIASALETLGIDPKTGKPE